MRRLKKFLHPIGLTAIAIAALTFGVRAADPPEFKPDGTFKGSTLTGWHTVGQAQWRAENGELVGRAAAGGNGGWLVMDKAFQDLMFYANLKCDGSCKTGVLLRAQKTPDGGMKGIYVSLTDGDFASYRVTIDAQGVETSRDRIAAAARAGGAGGAGGAAAAGGRCSRRRTSRRRRGRAGCRWPGRWRLLRAVRIPRRGRAGARGGRGRRRGAGAGARRAAAVAAAGVAADRRSPRSSPASGIHSTSSSRKTRCARRWAAAGRSPIPNATNYGNVALYIGGTGEVRYKDVAWKDLNALMQPKEQVSSRYHRRPRQRLLLRLVGGGRRHQSRRHHGHRVRTVLLPRAVVHRAADLPGESCLQPRH